MIKRLGLSGIWADSIWARRSFLCAVILFICSGACAQNPISEWAVAGGRIAIELNQGMLRPLGIHVEMIRPLEQSQAGNPMGYRSVSFEGLSLQEIFFDRDQSGVTSFSGGYLQYHGGLILHIGDVVLDATDFRMEPHPDHEYRFRLLDRSGTPWAVLDHGHFELVEESRALEIRHANLSMSRELAVRIGDDRLAGQVIGRVHVHAPVTRGIPVESKGNAQCATPNWPTTEGFDADISLIEMSQYANDPPVGSVGCRNCDGQGAGTVAITPNATLKNTGTADVPWWEQFTAPEPPYDNDQHAYLVWNLYRLKNGQFEQIGVSGLKHAFFSINVNCPCPGGNIVWVGCEDIYSISSNDLDRYLAPRSEVIPASAQWGRCGSLFDADCDGVHEPSGRSEGPFENRMLVDESDLLDPDARYFIEAWYVVRDDIDRFNTMGWREIDPQWNGSIWLFPTLGEFNQGPAIDAWIAATDGTAQIDRATLETPDGAITIVVRAAEQGNAWQYDYFVMNHDFMRAETAGSEPDLVLLSNIGLAAFEVEHLDPDAALSTSFARADRKGGGDWTATIDPERIRWSDSGDAPLDWGRGFRFSVVSDAAPGPAATRFFPGDASAILDAAVLGPVVPRVLFSDGFEATP